MHTGTRLALSTLLLALAWLSSPAAQTPAQKEEFSATAIMNDEVGTGVGRVVIQVNRWSTDAERARLVDTLVKRGSKALLETLQDNRPVGTIRTPDSLAYDLRYAHQTPGEDGGRRIVIATDRPIGFWETWNHERTTDYPFTVIQMQLGPDGRGKGTLSYAAKIRAHGNVIELENFSIAPMMLTNIEARPKD
jgi:hypothetical protein